MTKLLKVSDPECGVCVAMSEDDADIAKKYGYEFEVVELGDFAARDDAIRDYVIHYHVNEETRMIDLPVYVIIADGFAKASGVVAEPEELTNLIESWIRYLKSPSPDFPTE